MTERLDRRGRGSESRERRKEREKIPRRRGRGLCSSKSCWEQIRQRGSRRD